MSFNKPTGYSRVLTSISHSIHSTGRVQPTKNKDFNNNNRIERRKSRFFTISSLCHELSPTCTLNGPERDRVQITCNTSSAYHVQHAVCHMVRRDSSAIKFDRVEIAFILTLSLLVETISLYSELTKIFLSQFQHWWQMAECESKVSSTHVIFASRHVTEQICEEHHTLPG